MLGSIGTYRSGKAEEKMNVWYIALWVYMLAGEAIMLILAFDICRKEAAKDKKKAHRGS